MEKTNKIHKKYHKNKLCAENKQRKKIVLAYRIYSEFLVDIF